MATKDKAVIQFVPVLDEEAKATKDAKTLFERNPESVLEQVEMRLLATKRSPVQAVPNEAVMPPHESTVKASPPVTSQHKIFNLSTSQRLLMKVLCSDNRQFRVKPVHALIAPNTFITLILTRTANGTPSELNRLQLEYNDVYDRSETDVLRHPKRAFEQSAYQKQCLTILIRTASPKTVASAK